MPPADPPPDLPGEPSVSVPDDARDLGRDLRALQRERRAAARQQRWGRLLVPRRGVRALPVPLVVVLVLAVAGFAVLPVLMRPSDVARPQPEPLASPTALPGEVGGLLPPGPLTTPAGRTGTRALGRPVALLLVPTPCDCEPTLVSTVVPLQAATGSVRLVSTGRQDPDGSRVFDLRSGTGRGQVNAAVDEQGVLSAAYSASGVTLVLVGPDGVVVDVIRDLVSAGQLDPALTSLRQRIRDRE